MAQNRTLKLNLLADVTGFSKGLDKASKKTQSFSDRVNKLAKRAAAGFAIGISAAAAGFVELTKNAISAASDLNETWTKTQTIFGAGAKEIESFANSASKRFGLSKRAAMDAASTFAIFGKAAGKSGQDLVDFSTDLTKLAADFASFYNTSPEDAITAIGAALRGESEPIRRYGILLSQAAVESKALEMGLGEVTKTGVKLTETEKVLVRQKLILEQAGAAAGDFARTSEGLANQQRKLTAEIENLNASFGENLLPIALRVVSVINDKLLPAIGEISRGFSGDDNNGLSNKVRSLARQMDDKSDSYSLGQSLRNAANAIGELGNAILGLNDGDKSNALKAFADNINTIASAIRLLANAVKFLGDQWDKLPASLKKGVGDASILGSIPGGNLAKRAWEMLPGRANGGPVTPNGTYLVGERGPELLQMGSGAGRVVPNAGGGNTFIFQGVIDGESARRSIERLMRDSSRRTGPVSLNGAFV